jgi:hypothetical protein
VTGVIPYPACRKKNEADLPRVDQYFRTHVAAQEKQTYKQRSSMERVSSRQKEHLCLERKRARGLERLTIHALLCMIAMLLNALAVLGLNMPEKTRSITILAR